MGDRLPGGFKTITVREAVAMQCLKTALEGDGRWGAGGREEWPGFQQPLLSPVQTWPCFCFKDTTEIVQAGRREGQMQRPRGDKDLVFRGLVSSYVWRSCGQR